MQGLKLTVRLFHPSIWLQHIVVSCLFHEITPNNGFEKEESDLKVAFWKHGSSQPLPVSSTAAVFGVACSCCPLVQSVRNFRGAFSNKSRFLNDNFFL